MAADASAFASLGTQASCIRVDISNDDFRIWSPQTFEPTSAKLWSVTSAPLGTLPPKKENILECIPKATMINFCLKGGGFDSSYRLFISPKPATYKVSIELPQYSPQRSKIVWVLMSGSKTDSTVARVWKTTKSSKNSWGRAVTAMSAWLSPSDG